MPFSTQCADFYEVAQNARMNVIRRWRGGDRVRHRRLARPREFFAEHGFAHRDLRGSVFVDLVGRHGALAASQSWMAVAPAIVGLCVLLAARAMRPKR